jgi:Xaa-Pro aminopeptidase
MTTLVSEPALDLARMHRERHARLVDAMRDQSVEALLLLGQSNVGYATGARVPAADQARAIHRRAVTLVTADGESPHLWTWFPEGVPARLPADRVHDGVPLDLERGAIAMLDAIDAVGGGDAPLGVDELTMPLRAALHQRGREVTDGAPALSAAKASKTDDELACIRRAQQINEQAIAALAPTVHAGTRGTELTGAFLRHIFELGATANNVDPIWQVMPAAISDGPATVTGGLVFPTITTDRPFERGDVVWVDNGLSYEGYMSDYGHTWVVDDEPSTLLRDQCRRWRDVVDATLAVTRAGATAYDLTTAAEAAAGGSRAWLPHLYLAHGTGTESAEPPFVGTDLGTAFDASVVLAPGMVMVLEPVIWDDGQGGFRAEQIVTVTEDGWRSLSDLTWDGWE